MRLALITDSISPHQLPLSIQLANQVRPENFRYICDESFTQGRSSLGWHLKDIPEWVIITNSSRSAEKDALNWKINADVIISGNRDYKLYKKRAALGRLTFYMSERWFKPPWGAARLLFPHYFLMAWRIVSLLKSDNFYYLPIGVHAATDMLRLCGLFNNKLNFSGKTSVIEPILRIPFSDFIITNKNKLSVNPGEDIEILEAVVLRHMRLWGYFVDKSSQISIPRQKESKPLKIIWVGRLLCLKKVDTLILAVKALIESGADIQLTIIGRGPQKNRLKRLALLNGKELREKNIAIDSLKNRIMFVSPVTINEVREYMQKSDIYILPSNAYEGWGAVINEAMEEGCAVIASRESGAGITMIEHGKNGLLFDSGNVEDLKLCITSCYNDGEFLEKLKREAIATMKNKWGVEQGVNKILNFIKSYRN